MLRGWTGRIVMGAMTLATALAALALGMPYYWVIAFVAAATTAVFVVPAVVVRQIAMLDRRIQRHLQRREPGELLRAYREAWLARAFGPRTEMRLRLGRVLLEAGDVAAALETYERALSDADDADVPRFLPTLVRIRFLMGDDEGTLKAFAVLTRRGMPLPMHVYAAAHAALTLGRPTSEIASLVGAHLSRAGPADAAVADVVRARIALVEGDAALAAERLDGLDERRLPDEIRAAAALARALVLRARGSEEDAVAALRALALDKTAGRFAREAELALGGPDQQVAGRGS